MEPNFLFFILTQKEVVFQCVLKNSNHDMPSRARSLIFQTWKSVCAFLNQLQLVCTTMSQKKKSKLTESIEGRIRNNPS
jgi:hypothetical protein